MKIRYASDLHIDINTISDIEIMQKLNLYNIDVLILAGDTASYPNNLNFADKISQFYPNIKIIEVGGNHLYYAFLEMIHINNACKKHHEDNPNYYFLENDSVILDNIKFIGANLWTDLGKTEDNIKACTQALRDFNTIPVRDKSDVGFHIFKAEDCIKFHNKSKRYIKKEVEATPDNMNCIVITHHAPFMQYYKDEVSHAFCTDLTKYIANFNKAPRAWIFGHTHINMFSPELSLKNGKHMPILCNQFGYKDESKYSTLFNAYSTFDSDAIIEVK